ncbi:hypothetical protein AB1285_21265 [Microbacterium sp. NRRL B-14842]|uniref:hypothetical protein n=1 Tax=Microbacterium sp. NRRL B-14842 TaxID=3162881 RepID=UPI003D26F5F1
MGPEQRHECRGVGTPDRGVAVAGGGDAVESDRERREGGEVRVDVEAVVGEPRDVLLDQGQRPRLVAGDRGEHDVVRHDAQVVGVVLGQSVAAQVRGLRIFRASGAEVREEDAGERVLRLLAAGETALDHLLDEPDGVGVAIGLREESRELAAAARVAVAVLVARRGLELHAEGFGGVEPAGVPGVLEAGGQHAAEAESCGTVVRLHVVEHRGDLLLREGGGGAQRGRHPLELPHQVGAAVVEVGGEPLRVGVVMREAPGEGVQHDVGGADHVRRRGLPHPGFVFQPFVADLDGQRDRLRHEGLLRRAPRGAIDLLDELLEALLRTCHGGPFG